MPTLKLEKHFSTIPPYQGQADALPRQDRCPSKAEPTTCQDKTDDLSGSVTNRRLTFSLFHRLGTIVPSPWNYCSIAIEPSFDHGGSTIRPWWNHQKAMLKSSKGHAEVIKRPCWSHQIDVLIDDQIYVLIDDESWNSAYHGLN